MGLVKSGLCDLSEEQQCALENYAYTWPLTAKDWRAEFTLSPSGYDGDPEHDDEQNLTLAEQARQKLIPPMEEFIQTCRGKTAMGISKGVYFLLENLGAQAAVNDLAARLRHEQGIPAAEEVFREWNVVVDLLNQIGLLLGQDKITADEYGEMFTVLLRSADLGHIPETLDAVIFTTAGRMRLDDVEACFVMGLSEGEFPQAPGETGLLTHSDRDALIRQDIKMPDCFENRLIREKICFYKALTAAKSHLWLSWPGGSGGPELTSALDAVQECFAPQEPLLTTRDLAATPAMAMEELGRSFYENNAAAAAIFAALQERPEQKQAMDTLVRTAMEQPFQALDTKALEAVLGHGLRLSPSRVENFYTCRFAYFLQYVLRVRPRHKAELSPNQSGSLVHWVLEQAIKRSGEGFKTLPESKLRELAKSLAEEYARTNMPDTSERFQYLLRRLESNVADLLLFLQKDLCQSEFTPVAFEQPIGDGPGAVPPVRLKTPDGHEIRVVGTIDRVELNYWHAKNRFEQVLVSEQLLPIDPDVFKLPNEPRNREALTTVEHDYRTEFDFDPSASEVLGYLIPAYVRTVIFHAMLDSAAAEHGARRRAMHSATENAEEVVNDLSRTYNRVRQGSITTELNEIIGGASALEDK